MVDQAPQEPLIDFPCHFVIKVMGLAEVTFQETMITVIQEHDSQFNAKSIEHRYSASKKYISLSCQVWATSQSQLDSIYRDVSAHPLVKYAI